MKDLVERKTNKRKSGQNEPLVINGAINFIKNIGISISLKLIDYSIWEKFSYWLFDISYRGSREEINNALLLEFDTNWKWYNEFQLEIIKSHGLYVED